MNEHDSVIAISARSLDTIADGDQTFLILRAPDDVVATLEGKNAGRFKFEALVDDTWYRVELKATRHNGKEKGRSWRPQDDHRSQALIA